MKGIERFIELCMETWPDSSLSFHIFDSPLGEKVLQVGINGWLMPGTFEEKHLAQPKGMIQTMKMTTDDVVKLMP